MPARMYSLGALLALLVPTLALAWPVDLVRPLDVDKEQFQKLAAVEWVEVEDPSVAHVEVLQGSNELLLSGRKPGRTLMLLYAEGRFAVWRLTVGNPPDEDATPRLAAARKACPDLKASQGAERALTATVKDAACRAALLEVLRTDAFVARDLELTFDVPALQEQLTSFTTALQPLGLEARYSGAGLVVSGSASREDWHKALWELFRRSAGRVPLEDRVEVKAPEPSAATPDAGPDVKSEPPVEIEILKPAPKKPARKKAQ
ncbi:pilus assembly protein N-terminal domain-containing protein [Myxococcus sp. MISCRS1]|uniref:pilus assembly protein N-terminal domain-containing protein n=1 Tax=Myxococcus sp. MISCRS1 TaxID=2996786 RepID=UPI00226EB50C|nr:pilus assembly protein N-terminal domain-containing protein [Myxococcus sp. MISCRS1]MCY0998154.1 pilus assembly protein N-terminal domain-containing protein [Myxococcus sp. MISCRS1]